MRGPRPPLLRKGENKYMLETKDMTQFKDVDYSHNAITKYLKTPGELQEHTDLIKICPFNNQIRSIRLQVYRREDGIWQNGNTDRVKLKYKLYNADKQALTEYIDVPEGNRGTAQYVILDVEVTEETKYISFETHMINPVSSKEHRIKVEIISVNIDNLKMALMMAHNNLKSTYEEEVKPYWVHSFGPYNITKGVAKIDEDNIYMAIGSSTFNNYSNMTLTNMLRLDGTTNKYIYLKTLDTEYTNTLVWIEEEDIKIPINKLLDTSRAVNSDLNYKWISSYADSNYVINSYGQHSGGMTIIPETITEYDLNPSGYNFHVSKVKLASYRTINNQVFYENYNNPSTGEYALMQYSVDGGLTYHDVVTPSGSYIDIDIPNGVKKILFKHSARTNNKSNIYFSADIRAMEVFHRRIYYYTDIFPSTQEAYPVETVSIAGKRYKRYTYNLQDFFRDYSPLPDTGDIHIEFDGYDTEIMIGLYGNDGEFLTQGKKATWSNMAYYQVDVYIRESYTKDNPIKSIYITKFEERAIKQSFDTQRRTGLTQDFNSDSKRRIGVSANTIIKTQRHIIKSLISKINTKRLLNKRDNGYSDTNRKQIIRKEFVTDSKRSIGINKRITALTNRGVVKSFNILSDSSRLIIISKRLSLYDSKRRIAAADNSYTDSKRITTLNHSIKTDTTRRLLGQFFNNIKTKRLLIKNITSSIANTIRKLSNNAYIKADTTRTLTKHKDVIIDIDTLRTISKNSSINTDTGRNLVKSSRVNLNSKRHIVTNTRLYNDLTRKIIAINPDYYIKADTKRIVIKNKEIAADTKRTVRVMGDGYVRTAIEVKRIVIKNDDIVNDSKRFIARFSKVLVDSSRSTLNRAINSFDITRRTSIREYGSLDSKRTIMQPYRALLDSNRKMAIRVGKALDTCRKMLVGAKEQLLIDVKRITRQISNKRIDLYRKSVKIADIASDTYRNSITKEKNRAELIRKTIKEEIIWAEVTRDIYWHVDEVKYYDISRDIIVTDSVEADLSRNKVIQDKINIDSKREVYFEVEVNKSFDIIREVVVKEEFEIDTDRLPFYFVNKKCEAKRVDIYHGGVFRVDTSRQKYLENMLRIGYDTLRAVKVIKQNTKVYEYNIKVCNTLVYDIKVPDVINIK